MPSVRCREGLFRTMACKRFRLVAGLSRTQHRQAFRYGAIGRGSKERGGMRTLVQKRFRKRLSRRVSHKNSLVCLRQRLPRCHQGDVAADGNGSQSHLSVVVGTCLYRFRAHTRKAVCRRGRFGLDWAAVVARYAAFRHIRTDRRIGVVRGVRPLRRTAAHRRMRHMPTMRRCLSQWSDKGAAHRHLSLHLVCDNRARRSGHTAARLDFRLRRVSERLSLQQACRTKQKQGFGAVI